MTRLDLRQADQTDGPDLVVSGRSAPPRRIRSRQAVQQPGPPCALLRHLEEPYPPLVQRWLRQPHARRPALSTELRGDL